MEKFSVAIADDNERMVHLLEHIVNSDEELQVVGKATDGEQIVEVVQHKQPDIVLLDMIMPKLDGLAVMDRINQDPAIKKPAFVVISAVGQEQMTEEAEYAINEMLSRIEPSLVIVTSLITGAILLTVMLPLINIMKTIG